MKKYILGFAIISVLLSSFSVNDKKDKLLAKQSSTDILFQASNISMEKENSLDPENKFHNGVKEVIVGIDKLILTVNGQEVIFRATSGSQVDLLSFTSKDTLIWTNETLPIGNLEDEGQVILSQNSASNKVIEADGTEKPLFVGQTSFDFILDETSETEIEEGDKYVIYIDVANSLRLEENSNKTFYQLQQGTEDTEEAGTIYLERISESQE